jgi:hypothetical protein
MIRTHPKKPEATDARKYYREYSRRYIDDARAIHSTPHPDHAHGGSGFQP